MNFGRLIHPTNSIVRRSQHRLVTSGGGHLALYDINRNNRIGLWPLSLKRTIVESRPPLPPFTYETAVVKTRKAEDAWNTRDPVRVSLAYTEDSRWRNRSEFFQGRPAIVEFLQRKWSREQDYRLIKELWAFHQNRIAVRFAYEWHDDEGNWFRSHGNEQWEFDERGLMRRREASINDVSINAEARLFLWPEIGPRPPDHPGLSELGL